MKKIRKIITADIGIHMQSIISVYLSNHESSVLKLRKIERKIANFLLLSSCLRFDNNFKFLLELNMQVQLPETPVLICS